MTSLSVGLARQRPTTEGRRPGRGLPQDQQPPRRNLHYLLRLNMCVCLCEWIAGEKRQGLQHESAGDGCVHARAPVESQLSEGNHPILRAHTRGRLTIPKKEKESKGKGPARTLISSRLQCLVLCCVPSSFLACPEDVASCRQSLLLLFTSAAAAAPGPCVSLG